MISNFAIYIVLSHINKKLIFKKKYYHPVRKMHLLSTDIMYSEVFNIRIRYSLNIRLKIECDCVTINFHFSKKILKKMIIYCTISTTFQFIAYTIL